MGHYHTGVAGLKMSLVMKKPGRVVGEGEKESCEQTLRGQSAAELNESGSSHRTHLQGCNVYDTVSLVPSGAGRRQASQ